MCLSIAIHNPQNVLAKGEHLGFQWIVTNNGRAHRCGYVRVPPGHPWHGNSDDGLAEVHGGITFSEYDEPCDKGGPDDAWWIGFDCAHAWDLPDPSLPGYQAEYDYRCGDSVLRDQEYVEAQCRSLCEQAKRAEAT
jgi:hypothetical protein